MTDGLRWAVMAVLALPSMYLLLVSGYLLLLAAGASLYRKRVDAQAPPLHFAILIPAHNESGQIGAVLDDARNLDYPRERLEVFVIADNCTDDTAAKAREAGFTALERNDPTLRGKGHALDWCLREHGEALRGYDAIALVDADMHMDRRFLSELSATLSAGDTQVAQGLNTVSNPEASWRAALGYVGFTLINHVRPAGRCWLGGTSELKGSGMAFRSSLLLKTGWPAHSLAEDVEFSKQLLLDGVRVQYNPDALVTSGIPLQANQARVQQQRWEGGRLYLLRNYLPRFLVQVLRRPVPAHWDALVDLIVPPQSLLVLLYLVCIPLAYAVSPLWAGVLAAGLAAGGLAIVSGLILRRAPAKVWMYLLAVPLLLLWKLPWYLGMLFRKPDFAWQRTPRDSEVEKDK